MYGLWPVAAVSIALLLVAIALMAWHIRAWEAFAQCHAETAEVNYRRRQFRRRMQTSAMLALAAMALGTGDWVTRQVGAPWFVVVYWLAVCLLVCWMAALALIDAWSSRLYYGRIQQQCRLEEIKLQGEIRRLQAARNDGEADNPAKKPPS